MAKCVRCGKSMIFGLIKIKDAKVCHKCIEELGFEPWDTYYFLVRDYTWEDIKDGNSAMIERNRKKQEEFRRNNPELVKAIHDLCSDDEDVDTKEEIPTLNVNINVRSSLHKDLNETDGEAEIFDIITKMFPDDELYLKRKSNDYVTVMLGEWDIVRIKFNDKAQWVMFPIVEAKQKRHHLDEPMYIEDYEAAIQDSINHAKKYEN